jgi:GTP-binding protein EngB required for normal cell division
MSNSAQIAIDALHHALDTAPWIKEEERIQIERRITQIDKRKNDPRTFIAFIGEKKAGKTALVRALTGVPLPVAVRECTAAICEIQVGIDWYHEATYGTTTPERRFTPLSAEEQERGLSQAQKNKSQTKEEAQSAFEKAQQSLQHAQQVVLGNQEKRLATQELCTIARKENQEALGDNPWIWSFLSILAWLIPPIRRRIERIEESSMLLEQREQQLTQISTLLTQNKEEEQEKEKLYHQSEKNKHRKSEEAQGVLIQAQKAYDDAIEANELMFQAELTELIDVNEKPAERITIHTPNANIPNNIVLLDTPGFNTDLESHRRKAWEAIEELADICILVSDLRQPMPDTALNMLDRLEPFCPYMHVALTKTDLALSEAEELGDDPMEEVREAEAVARSRIKRHWDRPMNIWMVSSIEEHDQKKTQSLFQDFWKQLPDNARQTKTHLLSIHALREFMDILTVHIQIHKNSLSKIDVASDLAYAMAGQLEEQLPEIESKTQKLLARVKLETAEKIGVLEQDWREQIEGCETKRSLKKRWEELQKIMPQAYKKVAEELSIQLDRGSRRIAGQIFQGEGELEVPENELTTEGATVEEQSDAGTWVWTAGGIAAGATVGVILSSGIALSLLFAAGAGSMTRLLLSPLSKAKSNVIKSIEDSANQEQKNIQKQIVSLESEIAENVLKAAEEELRIQIQKREAQERAKKEAALQEVQNLLASIMKTRETLVRSNP